MRKQARPIPENVEELKTELRKAQEHLEMAWLVIANAGVSLGDWKSMPPEWQEVAIKWRDQWHQMRSANRNPREVRRWRCKANGVCVKQPEHSLPADGKHCTGCDGKKEDKPRATTVKLPVTQLPQAQWYNRFDSRGRGIE